MITLLGVLGEEFLDRVWARAHWWLMSAAAREAQAFTKHYPEALPRRR